KMGKDLAEQLKNGQPEAAQMTLQKMASQLQAAKLSPEQLQKMLKEVSQAVDPAKNYEKVSEHLKAACDKMGAKEGGDQQGASKELAEAAKQLEKLTQQMGDAQELAATLENLNQPS